MIKTTIKGMTAVSQLSKYGTPSEAKGLKSIFDRAEIQIQSYEVFALNSELEGK